jgi:type IV secretory pathway VirB10-like protein
MKSKFKDIDFRSKIEPVKKLCKKAENDTQKRKQLVAVLFIMAVVVLVVIIISTRSSESVVVVQNDFGTDIPPNGFFVKPEPEGINLSTPKEPLNSDDLFEKVVPTIDPEEQRKQQSIAEFKAKRSQVSQMKRAFINNTPTAIQTNYDIDNILQVQNMDKDFSSHQIPTTLTTLPVDLSRTLPMTEIIPVILVDEIKSELAGKVVRASIPQDVYSYHGKKILIPAGSTAIGKYEPLNKVGDTRLAINFYRIITPEGININLKGFASDAEGSEGLTGELDNKNLEKFSVAGLASMLQALAQLSVDTEDANQTAAANSLAQPMNEVIAQVISESINIAPTLRISKGTAFNIKFGSDIWFPQPINNVVNTVSLG